MNREREVPIRIIYRKKSHGHAHHGGAWKVAFADFMTAMFALFLVLWLINQSSDVKSAIAGYFQDPLGRADEFGSSILPGEGAQAAAVRPLMSSKDVIEMRRDRLQTFAERVESKLDSIPALASLKDKIDITITDDGLRIELLEDSLGVFFETGSAAPSERGRALLTMLGNEVKTMPNQVRIEGHTDARPYRTDNGYGNWELSTDRANAARRILVAGGLPETRLEQIRGLADRKLRDPQHPLAASNRRISITLLFPERIEIPPDEPPAPRSGT